MKVLLISDCNSPHTIKWATSLSKKGVKIVLFSLGVLKVSDYENTEVKVITVNNSVSQKSIVDKIQYVRALPKLKKLILKESPDIVHAHYATSYGLLGALSNFHPFVLSVWGSDIFDFPQRSFLHKLIIQKNLNSADKILSTSHVMAKETNLYINKEIEVTPFGIDMDIFRVQNNENLFEDNHIVIGTIKALEEKYGIIYLVEAFKILFDKYPELPLKLLLVGGGSLDSKIKKTVQDMEISDKVIFTGNIPFSEVPQYHNMIDIFVALSLEESFGVAIIEASSCETPVVVSNVGGLPEVVEDGVTGIVVPKENSKRAAEAIEKFVLNEELRQQMGKSGRERVKKLYDWDKNVQQMLTIYKNALQ